MKVVVTGASGFIGKELLKALKWRGHETAVLSRNPGAARARLPFPAAIFKWDPAKEPAPLSAFQGCDAVIHLAGEQVAGGRWTDDRKKAIFDSRVWSTRKLIETLGSFEKKPKIFISASAIGYYGNRPGETLNENSPRGEGFLAHACGCWEEEIWKAKNLGIRTSLVRIGIVLGLDGGILEKTLPVFRRGFGSILGNGRQWMSWVHVSDLVNIFIRILESAEIEGAFNGVSPYPVTNTEFSRALGKACGRPVLLKTPAFILRFALGEFAGLLLESQKISSEKIRSSGFQFQYPRLDAALKNILGGAL